MVKVHVFMKLGSNLTSDIIFSGDKFVNGTQWAYIIYIYNYPL